VVSMKSSYERLAVVWPSSGVVAWSCRRASAGENGNDDSLNPEARQQKVSKKKTKK